MSDEIRSPIPCNLLYHYQLIASLNNCFAVLFFAGNDIKYARKFAKEMLDIRVKSHSIMNSSRRTIFSARFKLNEQYFTNNELYMSLGNELILQAHCDEEDGRFSRLKLTDILSAEFRISVCIKTANIRRDLEQSIYQTVHMLIDSDIRYLQENMQSSLVLNGFSGRMEQYEDIINEQYEFDQAMNGEDFVVQNNDFQLSSKQLRSNILWNNRKVLDLKQLGISSQMTHMSNLVSYDLEPSFTASFQNNKTDNSKFEASGRNFRYVVSNRIFNVSKFTWNTIDIVQLAELSRHCRFSKWAEGRGYYFERFSKEELGQALTALTSQEFLYKCVAAVELPFIRHRLVVIGPACVGNTIASTVAIFTPLYVERHINYAPIMENAVECEEEPQYETIDFSPIRCSSCGRFRHEIRTLSSFIEVINSTIEAIDKEVLYDLLVDNWALADTCRQEVYYLPRKHNKSKYINQLLTVSASLRVAPVPKYADEMLYLEMRRCCDIAEKEFRELSME